MYSDFFEDMAIAKKYYILKEELINMTAFEAQKRIKEEIRYSIREDWKNIMLKELDVTNRLVHEESIWQSAKDALEDHILSLVIVLKRHKKRSNDRHMIITLIKMHNKLGKSESLIELIKVNPFFRQGPILNNKDKSNRSKYNRTIWCDKCKTLVRTGGHEDRCRKNGQSRRERRALMST